jgi:hypothetical protein
MSVSRVLAVVVLASSVASGVARAQAVDMGPAPDLGGHPIDPYREKAAPTPAATVAQSPHAGSPIAAALDEFDFGDYESVVERLRPLAENGARTLPNAADREEALRVYGIACTLTDRRTAAEGAFLLLLRQQPSLHLDPALVRPEAVAFFEEVRARHRQELVTAYRKGKPRYYFILDVLPLVGQIQNREWRKLAAVGAAEAVLLASSIVTGALLGKWQGNDYTFQGHVGAYEPMRVVNGLSFGLLLGVTTYGIIDGFVVGARRQQAERKQELLVGF